MTFKSRNLPEPLRTKDGQTIATTGEARDYALALPESLSARRDWQHLAGLLLNNAPVAEIGEQLRLALFQSGRLKL